MAIAMSICFTLGALSVSGAEAVAKYVTQKQRVKDLSDIAEQLVKLQNRIQYLEKCISNLKVDQYATIKPIRVNC